MSKGRQASVAVKREVRRLVLEEFGPSQIHGELQRQDWLDMERGLDLRTIQRMVKDLTPLDPSGPWSFADPDADPDEARLVLDVVADAFFASQVPGWPSKNLVAEIVRLRRAVPDIPSVWTKVLAREYQLCKEQRRDSRHLDFALGVRPWSSAIAADRLARALGEPRAFRVIDDVTGPLDVVSSLGMLVALVTFQGSIEDMGSRLATESDLDSILPPPDILVGSSWGDSRGPPDRPPSRLEPLDFDNLGASLGAPTREADAE